MRDDNKYETLFGNENASKYKKADYDLMKQRLIDYFKKCDELNKPYTKTGLANALYISKDALQDYAKKKPFAELVNAAYQKIEENLEECLYRLGNNNGVMFNLRVNYGWKDTQDITMRNEIKTSNLEDAFNKLAEVAKEND